jgi:hypothetical protein
MMIASSLLMYDKLSLRRQELLATTSNIYLPYDILINDEAGRSSKLIKLYNLATNFYVCFHYYRF